MFFLSWRSSNRDVAERFVKAIRGAGYNIYFSDEISPGSRWGRDVDRHVKSADCVIVLWTAESTQSEWVENEARIALKRNTIFPISVDGAVPPVEFIGRQCVGITTDEIIEGSESFLRIVKTAINWLNNRPQLGVGHPLDSDWRYIGGFDVGDEVLSRLPQTSPAHQTRYELCRSIIESDLTNRQDFSDATRRTFERYLDTADYEHTVLDAKNALMIAHELAHRYAELGAVLRKPTEGGGRRRKSPSVKVPSIFCRVYPNTVNTFLKDILFLIGNPSRAMKLGLGIRAHDIATAARLMINSARPGSARVDKLEIGPEVHAAYVLGRLRSAVDYGAIGSALSNFQRKLDTRLTSSPTEANDGSRPLRLTRRTVLLSRASLGNKAALASYLDVLQNNMIEVDINAGFHLEYYGDQPLHDALPMCSRDDGLECKRTVGHLIYSLNQAVNSNLNPNSHPLYLVEAYTLASIIGRRLHGEYSDVVRRGLPVIEVLQKRVEHEGVRVFLQLLMDAASSDDGFAYREFGKYMSAKNAPRNGWVERGVLYPETVGAHTCSLIWLASLLREDSEDLNISRVRRILEIHDLAEGVTSDLVGADRDAITTVERSLMRRFSWLGLYMDPRVDLFDTYSLHEEFCMQHTDEAKIAKDLDSLDIVLQGEALLKTRGHFDRTSVKEMVDRVDANIMTETVKALRRKLKGVELISADSFMTTKADAGVRNYYFGDSDYVHNSKE